MFPSADVSKEQERYRLKFIGSFENTPFKTMGLCPIPWNPLKRVYLNFIENHFNKWFSGLIISIFSKTTFFSVYRFISINYQKFPVYNKNKQQSALYANCCLIYLCYYVTEYQHYTYKTITVLIIWNQYKIGKIVLNPKI